MRRNNFTFDTCLLGKIDVPNMRKLSDTYMSYMIQKLPGCAVYFIPQQCNKFLFFFFYVAHDTSKKTLYSVF